jgi:hypothetical protein
MVCAAVLLVVHTERHKERDRERLRDTHREIHRETHVRIATRSRCLGTARGLRLGTFASRSETAPLNTRRLNDCNAVLNIVLNWLDCIGEHAGSWDEAQRSRTGAICAGSAGGRRSELRQPPVIKAAYRRVCNGPRSEHQIDLCPIDAHFFDPAESPQRADHTFAGGADHGGRRFASVRRVEQVILGEERIPLRFW